MNRIVKFRAKSMLGGWVYGNFIHSKRFDGCLNEFRIHETETGIEYDIIPDTLGQFIGLMDCNGKDIYEGDVISVNGSYEKVVQYVDDEYGFCVANISDFKNLKCMYVWQRPAQNWWNDSKREIKIIGNIHDNPELLKI